MIARDCVLCYRVFKICLCNFTFVCTTNWFELAVAAAVVARIQLSISAMRAYCSCRCIFEWSCCFFALSHIRNIAKFFFVVGRFVFCFCTFANFPLFLLLSMSLCLPLFFRCFVRFECNLSAPLMINHILLCLFVSAVLALDATDVHTLRYCRQTICDRFECFHFQRSASLGKCTSREIFVCFK